MTLKVFVSDIFDRAALTKFRKSRAKAVLCNQLKTSLPEGVQLFDANSARIEGTWTAWHTNAEVLKGLFNKAPVLRDYDDLDLAPAFRKTVLWANRKSGYLSAWLKIHKHVNPINPPNLYECKRHRVTLKYLKMSRKASIRVSGSMIPPAGEPKIAFLVEDLFELRVLLPVAEALERKDVCWVVPPHHRFRKLELNELEASWNIWIAPPSEKLLLPRLAIFRFNKKELFCLNAWMSDLKIISDTLHWGFLLFKSPVKVLVTLAQENTHIGHIVCGQAKKLGKHTVNTMNGIKTAEAISAEADFSAWLVWDNMMKKILEHEVNIPADQLQVAGGLQQDQLSSHCYANTINVSETDIKEHRIVSVFSAKDMRTDKIEALNTLYNWAHNQKNIIILYRPHPLEPVENYVLPAPGFCRYELIKAEPENRKVSLMDQLLISDLVLNFGSTVSIEASWMGTPSVTFESKAKSDLYCVDGETVKHVRNAKELNQVLSTLEKKKSRSNTADTASGPVQNVARKYSQIIKHYATI